MPHDLEHGPHGANLVVSQSFGHDEVPHTRSCFAERLRAADLRRVLAWRDEAARLFGRAQLQQPTIQQQQMQPGDELVDATAADLEIEADDEATAGAWLQLQNADAALAGVGEFGLE